MRNLYAFVVDEIDDGMHVMVVSDTGTGIMNIHASDVDDAKDKVGFTSDNLHDLYSKLFPEGWNIEWISEVEFHEGLKHAMHLNNLKMCN